MKDFIIFALVATSITLLSGLGIGILVVQLFIMLHRPIGCM